MSRMSLADALQTLKGGRFSVDGTAHASNSAVMLDKRELFLVRFDPESRFPEPTFVVNQSNVDSGGVHSLQVDQAFLAESSESLRSRRRALRTAAAEIVAEGDSWFDLPNIFYPSTMLDYLQETYAVSSFAHWGDTLSDMIAKREYLAPLSQGSVKVLLFSAGGNDFMDRLGGYLPLLDPDHTEARHAKYYVTAALRQEIKRIAEYYLQVLAQIRSSASRNARLVVHGYGYARPYPNGPFIGSQMQGRGLHPGYYGPLCRRIIELIIDEWNKQLAAVAARSGGQMTVVDLRPLTVADNVWFDEIHVRSRVARQFADKMARVIGNLMTVAAKPAPRRTTGRRTTRSASGRKAAA